MSTFAIPNEKNGTTKQKNGAIAQLVEQRTENPCVPGSIPGGTTKNRNRSASVAVFCGFTVIFVCDDLIGFEGLKGKTLCLGIDVL